MRKLYLLLEGEADIKAAPLLLGRLLREKHGRHDWQTDARHTIKVWGLTKLLNDLPRFVEHLRNKADCGGALILLDLDAKNSLPCVEAPRLAEAIAARRPLPFPVAVVFAYKEYEAWFLASIPSIAPRTHLLPDALTYPGDPEGKRGAKEWLSNHMPPNTKYKVSLHQAEFTRYLDFAQARQAPSFGRLERALGELLAAVDAGAGAGVVSPRWRG